MSSKQISVKEELAMFNNVLATWQAMRTTYVKHNQYLGDDTVVKLYSAIGAMKELIDCLSSHGNFNE